jgi:hypothetical protein
MFIIQFAEKPLNPFMNFRMMAEKHMAAFLKREQRGVRNFFVCVFSIIERLQRIVFSMNHQVLAL